MTAEENYELNRLAWDLAYQTIKFSGLWKELANEDWDTKTKEYAQLARNAIADAADAEFTRLEALQPR